jgi:hypothetical protein
MINYLLHVKFSFVVSFSNLYFKFFGESLFSLLEPGISRHEPFDDLCKHSWEKLFVMIARKMSLGIKTAEVEEMKTMKN